MISSAFQKIKGFAAGIAKDPLSHFVVIGCAVYALTNPAEESATSQTINLTPAFVQQLESQFHHTFLRPPTAAEQQQLIDQAMMDLALYYEGLNHNLDKADQVVKRRIIQKMNFIIEGMANPGQPSLPELTDFMAANAEQFRLPQRFDFEHVFVNGKQEQQQQRATELLAQLNSATASATNTQNRQSLPLAGDPFLRGNRFTAIDSKKIDAIFGDGFTQQLSDRPAGDWFGPVASRYGLHLVRINQISEATIPKFNDVKDKVYAAWKSAKTEENIVQIKQRILAQYRDDTTTTAIIKKTITKDEQHVALN